MDSALAPRQRPKILLADDAEIGRSILKALLRSDFDVVEARNGLEAIQVLTSSSGSIAAVILDVVMPVMDGFRVLKFMREKELLGRIPAILVTAISDDDTKARCFEAGATDVIEKPYDEKLIVHKIRAIVSCFADQNARLEEENEDNAYVKDILDAIPDAVYATDPATHSIKICNAAFFELPGIPEDAVGRDIRDVLAESALAAAEAVWEDLVMKRVRSARYFRFPSDPRIWRITYNALLDDDGKISDYIGIIADTTPYVNAAPELEAALLADRGPEDAQ